MSKATQSNTQAGDLPFVAAEDLAGMEGRVAVLGSEAGKPVAGLPLSVDDPGLFVLTEGADAGGLATLRPLEPGRNVRLVLAGSCAPGDVLVLADTDVEADRGKVRAVPAEAGTYRGLAVAEESGVNGQWVLARPASLGVIEIEG